MSIKTILVPFAETSDSPAATTAPVAARHLRAHVVGLHVESKVQGMPGAQAAPAMAGMSWSAYGSAMVRQATPAVDPMAAAARQSDQAAQAIKAGFTITCRELEVPVLEDEAPAGSARPLPSASCRRESGDMPFLAEADDVVLFHAGDDGAEWLAEEKAADYLAWHGVEAKVEHRDPGPAGVADFLMSQCSERRVGLMVMGADSHSRLRERLFGGVTLTVLSNVAATPVLIVH